MEDRRLEIYYASALGRFKYGCVPVREMEPTTLETLAVHAIACPNLSFPNLLILSRRSSNRELLEILTPGEGGDCPGEMVVLLG